MKLGASAIQDFVKTRDSKFKTTVGIGLLMGIIYFLSGCASALDSNVANNVDLKELKSIFVEKLPADGRGVEKLIADELISRGYQASYGDSLPEGESFDAMITYQDKWMWDITMYMIELRVQVLDPENRFVMASGHCYRTSLIRKSPEGMVEEVIGEIFK